MYLPGCAITSLTQYQTPFYNLSVDTEGEHKSLNLAGAPEVFVIMNVATDKK